MIPYFLCLALSGGFCYLARKSTLDKSVSNLFISLAFITFVLFAGLRDRTVGTDTGSYVRSFEAYVVAGADHAVGLRFDKEPGFILLQEVAACFSGEYYVLMIGIALLFVGCSLYVMRRYSENILVSVFVFVCLGYYTFCFNAARQSIALGLYMLSFRYLIRRSFIKYCAIVLLAAMFHKSIIIAIPVYFLLIRNYSVKTVMLLILTAGIVFFALHPLLDYAATQEGRYSLYQSVTATGGEMLTLFYFLLSVYFMRERKNIAARDSKLYDLFLNMLLLGTAIYLLVYFSKSYVELTRFAAYFQISAVFLWPLLFRNMESGNKKSVVKVLFVLGHLIFFSIFLDKMADLIPYTINHTLTH